MLPSIRWILLLLAISSNADAALYVCDCQPGALATCQAGNDANAGSSPLQPWQSYERARVAFGSLPAGDSISFCRGGAFLTGAASRWVNAQCRSDAPCTVGAYQPAWTNGETPRPIITRSSGSGFGFDDTGTAEQEQGYRFSDLDLRCTSCARDQAGFFFFNDTDDVALERIRVSGFGIGVYVSGSNGCTAGASNCDGVSAGVRVRDAVIENNLQHGFLGGGHDLLIETSRFTNNGGGSLLDHNIYLAGMYARATLRGNQLYRASLNAGSCNGASLVVHGQIDDLVVDDNVVREDIGLASANCWGINITPGNNFSERFLRAIVRRNRILNVGTAGIALASCVDCVVENNVIVHEQAHAIIGIRAPAASFGSNDAELDALTVRNNSIFIATSNSVAIDVGGQGDGHRIISNAIQSTAQSGFFACMSLNLPSSAYAAVDHNVCGYVAGTGREWEMGSGALPAWRALSGLDANSHYGAPGFASPGSPLLGLQAASGSELMVDAGHPTLSAPGDILNQARLLNPDSGAFEWAPEFRFADGFE